MSCWSSELSRPPALHGQRNMCAVLLSWLGSSCGALLREYSRVRAASQHAHIPAESQLSHARTWCILQAAAGVRHRAVLQPGASSRRSGRRAVLLGVHVPVCRPAGTRTPPFQRLMLSCWLCAPAMSYLHAALLYLGLLAPAPLPYGLSPWGGVSRRACCCGAECWATLCRCCCATTPPTGTSCRAQSCWLRCAPNGNG